MLILFIILLKYKDLSIIIPIYFQCDVTTGTLIITYIDKMLHPQIKTM